jgi:transcriptional regulator with XRE-family HTH domain/SAM-dependent methyltransferase
MAPKPPDLSALTDTSIVLIDGERLKKWRDEQRWSQDRLAVKAGVSVRVISRIETERDENGPVPYSGSFGVAKALAIALGRPPEELIAWTQAPGNKDDRFTSFRHLAATATALRQTTIDAQHVLRSKNNLIFTFIASDWQRQLVDITISGARVEVVIKADAYHQCLSRLTREDRLGICAFADLTDPTEREIWKATTDPETTWVSKRTLWITWPMVYHDATFKWVLELLHRQSVHRPEEHNVHVGVMDRPTMAHPLGPHAIGRHLLLHEESHLTGGHRSNGDVVLIYDRELCRHAKSSFYSKLEKETVRFEPHFDKQTLLAALAAKAGGSAFEPAYTVRTRFRPLRYFDDYPTKIPRWVPCYEDLSQLCAKRCIQEIHRRINRHPTNRIFEIGVGTGRLPAILLPLIDTLNKSATGADLPPYVDHYSGIDESPEMIERIPQWIRDHKLFDIKEGTFPSNYTHAANHQRAHIVLGNLVLHDILGPSSFRKRTLREFLQAARELVTEDGVLIFGDAFLSPELPVEEQKTAWNKGQMRRGMTAEEAKDFIDRNLEMVETVTAEELAREAGQYGFGFKFEHLPAVTDETNEPLQLPFGLLILFRLPDSKSGSQEPNHMNEIEPTI